MQRVAVLADSRGLDTYYLNPRYPAGYGIDAVFATRLDRLLLNGGEGGSGRADGVFLIPDHFRSGSLESKILRLALIAPSHVLLCDGIWETLLNREKFFMEAAALGALDPTLFGREDVAAREEAGRVLTDLFLAERLSVSPARHAAQLEALASYFARRRRAVAWLSLPVPPANHCDGRHFAGDYWPLPGWGERLAAVNAAAKRALMRWDGCYIDLDPLVAEAGGAGAALLDLWHFTAPFHARVAAHLAQRMAQDWRGPPLTSDADHPSHAAMLPGRAAPERLCVYGDTCSTGLPDGIDWVDAACVDGLRDAALILAASGAARADLAPDLLRRLDGSVVLLYPEELGAPAARGSERRD